MLDQQRRDTVERAPETRDPGPRFVTRANLGEPDARRAEAGMQRVEPGHLPGEAVEGIGGGGRRSGSKRRGDLERDTTEPEEDQTQAPLGEAPIERETQAEILGEMARGPLGIRARDHDVIEAVDPRLGLEPATARHVRAGRIAVCDFGTGLFSSLAAVHPGRRSSATQRTDQLDRNARARDAAGPQPCARLEHAGEAEAREPVADAKANRRCAVDPTPRDRAQLECGVREHEPRGPRALGRIEADLRRCATEQDRVVAERGLQIGDVDDDALDGMQHAPNIARLFRYSLSAPADPPPGAADCRRIPSRMPTDPIPSRRMPTLLALLAGGFIGLGLLLFARGGDGRRSDYALSIGIDGVSARMARDLLLPTQGWTLQITLTPAPPADEQPELVVELREERTGMTVEVQDDLIAGDGFHSLVIPEQLGLREGLLAVRARAVFPDGSLAEDWRRLRIRAFEGRAPIGGRQIVHYDFGVDRDGNGRPDFEGDLAQLGLVDPGASAAPGLARAVADRVAERALARVLRAYAASDDPNRTGAPADPVAIRFQLRPVELESERTFSTRICVGGRDPGEPGSVGHVRFDARNARRAGEECTGEEAAGLFPAELVAYRSSPLYREVLGAFDPVLGGVPFAGEPERAEAHALAIAVVGDVLGTLMAHETGHALGLVAPGRPGVGLFGGETGEEYAHAVDTFADDGDDDGDGPGEPISLMAPGRRFKFEDLAGVGAAGELRFRPIDYAYLRDRVVLQDPPRAGANPRE